MEHSLFPASPPPPSLVVTPWTGSRGQDLLGLRAPAERIANSLMDGVTTISPLVRYISFRSWIIHRYAALGGPNDRASFYGFAGKCEAALVMGHWVAEAPTTSLIGTREAAKAVATGGPLTLGTLTENLAVDAYAGPSQDLAIALPLRPVPGLTTERGVPLASAVKTVLDQVSVLSGITASTKDQTVDRTAAAELAIAFPMTAPTGLERELLIDAILPPKPLPGEFARLAAYCNLLHLCHTPGAHPLEEEDVFRAAIVAADSSPPELSGVADGWLRFLIRDLLTAVHERAVAVVLDVLRMSPERTLAIEQTLAQLSHLDPQAVLAEIGLPALRTDSPISELVAAVRARCTPQRVRSGLARWQGAFNELTLLALLDEHTEHELLCLLPVAWILAYERSKAGLGDHLLSIDHLSGASTARLGIAEFVAPAVAVWEHSRESIGNVVATLVRRSVDQHLSIAWYRMQADPSRNVSMLIADGSIWSAPREFFGGRATSRLYQALSWLTQLGLVGGEALTADGSALLKRGLRTLQGREDIE